NGNARPYDPAPVPADDELRAQLQETLMGALGLTLDALRKISEPAIASQAVSAAASLKRQAPTHYGLNELLKLVVSENNRALEPVQDAVDKQYDVVPLALVLVEGLAGDV